MLLNLTLMESDRLTKLPPWPRFIRIAGVFAFTSIVFVIYSVIRNWNILGTPKASDEIWLAARNGFRAGFVLAITFVIARAIIDVVKAALEPKPKLPSERLAEEFEAQHPGRTLKEAPPVPILPPPTDDNPYSYH